MVLWTTVFSRDQWGWKKSCRSALRMYEDKETQHGYHCGKYFRKWQLKRSSADCDITKVNSFDPNVTRPYFPGMKVRMKTGTWCIWGCHGVTNRWYTGYIKQGVNHSCCLSFCLIQNHPHFSHCCTWQNLFKPIIRYSVSDWSTTIHSRRCRNQPMYILSSRYPILQKKVADTCLVCCSPYVVHKSIIS